MRNLKKLAALFLAAALIFSLSAAAFAAVEDTGFSDVDAGAWYAGAVMYCNGHDLMTGTGNGRFDPGSTMTRAQFAMVLHRLKGTPAVTGTDAFTDTADGAWYSDAVLWVSQQGLIGGYGGGLFGPNDPVNREQIAAILWRYEGCPKAEQSAGFADGDAISSYAADAVDWAKANGIINGRTGNLFAPKASATRAEVATMLQRFVDMVGGK